MKLTVYEDFRCSACGSFESGYQSAYKALVKAGKVELLVHPVDLIDNNEGGSGSLAAGNAAACAQNAGKFEDYHDVLYANQPTESNDAFASDGTLISYAKKVSGLDTPDLRELREVRQVRLLDQAELPGPRADRRQQHRDPDTAGQRQQAHAEHAGRVHLAADRPGREGRRDRQALGAGLRVRVGRRVVLGVPGAPAAPPRRRVRPRPRRARARALHDLDAPGLSCPARRRPSCISARCRSASTRCASSPASPSR